MPIQRASHRLWRAFWRRGSGASQDDRRGRAKLPLGARSAPPSGRRRRRQRGQAGLAAQHVPRRSAVAAQRARGPVRHARDYGRVPARTQAATGTPPNSPRAQRERRTNGRRRGEPSTDLEKADCGKRRSPAGLQKMVSPPGTEGSNPLRSSGESTNNQSGPRQRAFVELEPMSEPASLTLLVVSLAGLAALRRRRIP